MPSLADLIRMGKQYVSDALPGGTLNSEVNRQGILDGAALSTTAVPVLGDLLGLGADINRYATDPESRTAGNFALSGLGMLPFVPAMTAWHGSPHKFDKFSLDKIGTGEGAQAYGHGLYLAETPEIAGFYKDKLSNGTVLSKRHLEPAEVVFSNTGDLPESTVRKMRLYAASYANKIDFNDADSVKSFLKVHFPRAAGRLPDNFSASSDLMSSGNLYKTDIPDEAVARMLDWDKPLSGQSPEVYDAIRQMYMERKITVPSSGPVGSMVHDLGMNLGASGDASKYLASKGIPGIRYLDGGSRSTGQGSSNFVAFDPEMIRILERNGQPTGLEPWKPGEYSLKDLIPK